MTEVQSNIDISVLCAHLRPNPELNAIIEAHIYIIIHLLLNHSFIDLPQET